MNYGKREMGKEKREKRAGLAFPVSPFPFPAAGGSI